MKKFYTKKIITQRIYLVHNLLHNCKQSKKMAIN